MKGQWNAIFLNFPMDGHVKPGSVGRSQGSLAPSEEHIRSCNFRSSLA